MKTKFDYRIVPVSEEWQWSGKNDPFPVGTRVMIILNGWKIGGGPNTRGDIPGTVVGYKISSGWLMAVVEADFTPHWFRQENGTDRVGVFAGCELEHA